MAKKLADMTAEERAECVGMWASVTHSVLETRKAIILRTTSAWGDETCAIVVDPVNGEQPADHERVTPLPDLPRVWTPQGQPVPGEWADGHMWWGEDADTMQTVDLVGAECLTTGQIQGLGEWPKGVTPGEDVPVRRWVGEWEPLP